MIRCLLVVLGVAGTLAGCAPGPTGTPLASRLAPPPTERIVVLAGTVGAMTLVAPDSAGTFRAVTDANGSAPGIPANAAWLSSDGSQLLATTLDGRALLGTPDMASSSGTPGLSVMWRAGSGDLAEPHPLRAFGSLGSGAQVAFVEGDPGAGTPGRLVVETLEGSTVRTIALPLAAESPPAWLPDGRIAVIVRDQGDEPETLLVDADGRPRRHNGQPLRSIAIGGDTVALIDAGGSLRVGTIGAWLAGSTLQPIASGDPGETALQAQPSPSGTALAVVVADVEGDGDAIRILAAAGGWHEIARFGLPAGANRAVVGWLAVP